MATPLVTPRDLDLLQALDHCPLTAKQLLTLSETFRPPFTSERKVRARLQLLEGSGRVRRWPYAAIAGRGLVSYFTLRPLGHRLLYGPDAERERKRSFGPVGLARQQHTHLLAEFLVGTLVAAHRANVQVSGFCRENSVCLTAEGMSVYPDCGFVLTRPGVSPYRFFVEVDNRTERVRSEKDADSWQRKIRTYEAVQDKTPARFRVLVLTTGGPDRLAHILAMAAELARNPSRSLLYGATLDAFRQHPEPLTGPCFLDHRTRTVSLIPSAAAVHAFAPLLAPQSETPASPTPATPALALDVMQLGGV